MSGHDDTVILATHSCLHLAPVACTQIKDRLLIEDKRIEAFELRKNKDNNRKFNKQVKEMRKEEGAQNRKSHIREVSNIRKDASADSGDKDERIKKIIDEPATKSKKRINMVCVILLC